ncbi:MAG: hypothetical protein PCFJNLEI_00265 [Verrucomicrobiae bacterium]|nr:hypothetical protein [Verrucomicrobiae bacterium]
MTAGTEAGALLEEAVAGETGVGDLADHHRAGRVGRSDLGVTFETEIVVTLDEEIRIDRAVGVVTGGATFAHGFVFKDTRAGLFFVALRANRVGTMVKGASRLVDVVTVRVVTRGAVHFPFADGMMRGEAEFRAFVEVTLETTVGFLAGKDEFAFAAASFDVETAGAVTRLAAEAGHFFFIDDFAEFDPGMLGAGEVFDFFLVAERAGIHPDVFGAGNHRRDNDDAVDGGAGDSQRDQRQTANRADHNRIGEVLFLQGAPHFTATGRRGSRAARQDFPTGSGLPEDGAWERVLERLTHVPVIVRAKVCIRVLQQAERE